MAPRRPTTAYLALGSNLGDRLALLRGGRRALDEAEGVRVAGSSALYETDPVGGPEEQRGYYNAVLAVATMLEPLELLRLGQSVEERFGRRRKERWGPRTLDIDLLLYGAEIRNAPELILPHSRMHLRRFVLAPLADLAPGLTHPILGATIEQLLAALPETEGVRPLCEHW